MYVCRGSGAGCWIRMFRTEDSKTRFSPLNIFYYSQLGFDFVFSAFALSFFHSIVPYGYLPRFLMRRDTIEIYTDNNRHTKIAGTSREASIKLIKSQKVKP